MVTTRKKSVPAPQRRSLCTVCKSRFAFNDDGTCNDRSCPSYSTRVKNAAAAVEAEREQAVYISKMKAEADRLTAAERAGVAAGKNSTVQGALAGVKVPPAAAASPASKPDRKLTRHWWANGFTMFTITNGKDVADYLAEQLVPGVFTCEKLESGKRTCYRVNVNDGCNDCGCEGFRARRTCRHVEALRTLRQTNRG